MRRWVRRRRSVQEEVRRPNLDKYAVRFYAPVDWKTLYVHGLFDNGSGNTTVERDLERYRAVFPQMCRPMATKCSVDSLDPNSASALWVAMLSLQHQQLSAPSGKRVVIMDSFYTRHAFAKHVLSMTAGEIRIITTCRLNFIDTLPKPAVETAVLALKYAAHGAWKLVAAIDIAGGTLKEAEEIHKTNQKKLKITDTTPFVPDLYRSPHVGFIVFRDKKVVVFYTNDLAFTPSADVLDGDTIEAQQCCNGIAIVQRWMGSEVFRRSSIRVSVVVAAYNTFMNTVDRFDQLRSSNPTQRRERGLQMSVFTWLLDVAIHNAIVMYLTLTDNSKPTRTIRAVKKEIINALLATQRQVMTQLQQKATYRGPIEQIVGSDSSLHMLTRSRGKLVCMLCSVRGGKNRVKYACTRCRRGFNVECFMAIHYKHMMTENAVVMEALDAVILSTSGMPVANTRHRKNSSVIEPREIEFPCLVVQEPLPVSRKRSRISPTSS